MVSDPTPWEVRIARDNGKYDVIASFRDQLDAWHWIGGARKDRLRQTPVTVVDRRQTTTREQCGDSTEKVR